MNRVGVDAPQLLRDRVVCPPPQLFSRLDGERYNEQAERLAHVAFERSNDTLDQNLRLAAPPAGATTSTSGPSAETARSWSGVRDRGTR